MKRFLFLGVISSLLLFLASCSNKVVEPGVEIDDLPEWVQNFGDYPGGLGAVGSAPRSPLGAQMQRDKATMQARTTLARQLAVKVQNALTASAKELQETAPDASQIIASEFTENTTRQVVSQTLVGSRPKAQWRDPQSDELYIWVVIDEKDLAQRISSAMRRRLKEATEDHHKALEVMDKQIKQALETP